MSMVIKDGLYWPASDEICYDAIIKDIPFLQQAAKQCKKKRTVIQAGGNAGMYPVELAKHFKQVLTFEPEPLNFQCLTKNIENLDNVKATNAVLGDTNDTVGLKGWTPNCGAYEVSGAGDVEQIRIDDLKLTDVDLIQLDVQGYEGNVLRGGLETIKKCSPLIILEEGYGVTPLKLLEDLGYEAVTQTTVKGRIRDTLYVRKTGIGIGSGKQPGKKAQTSGGSREVRQSGHA